MRWLLEKLVLNTDEADDLFIFVAFFEKLTAVVRVLFYFWNWSTSHSHASKTTDSAVREKKLVRIPRRVRGTKTGKVDCNLVQDLSTVEHLCVLTCSAWLEILIHLIGAIGIELIAALHPVSFHACGYTCRFNVHFYWEASPLLGHSEKKYFLWLKMAHLEAEMSLENSFTNQIVSNLSLLPSLWTGWESVLDS